MIDKTASHTYTKNILIQMVVVFLLLFAAVAWQRDIIYDIYIANQINAVGWTVNGGILLLFLCGLYELIKRFYSYRNEELSIQRFFKNISNGDEPLRGIERGGMLAERFLTLKNLNRQRANINHNALAATLLASESSRNSFLKFVHNVLILTGVFGTIISLSISLLGASDLIESSARIGIQTGEGNNIGMIIYGMSTALSTTMTAIIAYLFFGYFYIKLTDSQTYLISKVEEITTTTLLPHVEMNQETVIRDYSEIIQASSELIKKLDQSQEIYAELAKTLQLATEQLGDRMRSEGATGRDVGNEELMAAIRHIIEIQQQGMIQNNEGMSEIMSILERGFRL